MGSLSTMARACMLWALFAFIFISSSFGQTLTVAAQPSSLTIFPGQQNVAVGVTLGTSSYSGPITVTMTGLPSGITCAPVSLTAGSSGTLYLNATVAAGQEGFNAGQLGAASSWTANPTVVAAAGATLGSKPVALTISLSNPSFTPDPANINLPIVTINTNNVPIVDKTTNVPGTITITSADGQTSYLPSATNSDNTATFHLHGTSTLEMPKHPYHIKLTTSLDLLNAMGLSCPYVTSKGKPTCDKSKSYLLLANYDDKTFLRDWSASALANAIPMGDPYLSSPAGSPSPSGTSTLMPWASHSLFVELYVNGEYEGNYQLIEQIKVDSHRVSITELGETDISDDITGGYLLEIDHHEDEAFVFTTPQGLPIGLVDPDFTPDPEVPQQTTYISNYVDTAETALFGSNYTDPALGWRAYFDEASAVNFYIVNDLMGNVDGGDFYSSNYLYKAVDNPLLYMGPVWDFDISSGNVNYTTIVNPATPWMNGAALWYNQLFTDPGFKADVAKQWNALKSNGVLASWIESIVAEAQTLEKSQANNFGRWPMQGIEVWPNPEAAGSYDGEVQYLTTWLQLRAHYLDSVLNNKAQTTTTLSVGTGPLRTGAPATLTAQVTGGVSPGGQVSFLSSGMLLGTTALNGGTASLAVNLPAGADNLQAVYGGDPNNALSASTPQAATVAAALLPVTLSVGGSVTAVRGAAASFTAAVIPNQRGAVPTGSVGFSVDNGTPVPATVNGAGQATYSTTTLAVGPHSILAVYSGDSNYNTGTGSLPVTIDPGVSIGCPTAASGEVGVAYKSGAMVLTDGTPPYSFTVVGPLPPGLSLDSTTGAVTGTPLGAGSFSIMVTDGRSSTDTSCAITILPAVSIACPTAATGVVGVAYDSGAMQVSGGASPFGYSVVGTLPTGLNLNSTTGEVTGTPTAAGSYSIMVTDGLGGTATTCLITINVPASFTISGTSVSISPGAVSGDAATITVTPAGGFTGKVTLTAAITGSPAQAANLPTLSFGSTNPVNITGTTPGTATLTVATTAASNSAVLRAGQGWRGAAGLALAGVLLFGVSARRRRVRTMLGLFALLVLLTAGVSSCGGSGGSSGGGGSPGTTAGTYTVTVTGSSGSLTAKGTVTVIVQ